MLNEINLEDFKEIFSYLLDNNRKLVSEGKATILNLTDEILNWIKTENLADKLYINF